MTPEAIKRLLEEVAAGKVDVHGALAALKDLPFEDLGFAKVDHHRALRLGAPEVIFGQGKAPDDLGRISKAIVDRGQALLVTRVDDV
jgi:pyridinium-3,5-biscarboxylic acid mononucleotide synthase